MCIVKIECLFIDNYGIADEIIKEYQVEKDQNKKTLAFF